MAGATLEQAARLAGRTSGDSTVAYALAFAHAVEAALDIAVPPRARYLRALMAELERLANHFGDIGAICNDASFALMHAHCGILRERMLRAADACFGHRLMMDRIVPGGVACRSRGRRRRAGASMRSRKSGDVSPSWSSSTTTPPRCRTAPSTTGIRPRRAGAAVRRRRLCRARQRPRLRCAQDARLSRPTTSSASRCRCSRPATSMRASGCASARSSRASALIEQILQRLPDGAIAAEVESAGGGVTRRSRAGRRLPRRRAGVGAARRRSRRALPSARPVLVPVAAAGSGDRGQHRRRLSALQQIVQLLLFGPRSLGLRRRTTRCAERCSKGSCAAR